MIALEFSADKARAAPFAAGTNPHRLVSAKAMELNLMVRPLPYHRGACRSRRRLCITEADCDEAVDLFARALETATRTSTASPRRAPPEVDAPAARSSCRRFSTPV